MVENMINAEMKRQLKQEYKMSHRKMGVYQIKNEGNGKIFIGSACDLNGVWERHRLELRMGSHRNKTLNEDWRSQEEEDFSSQIASAS